MDSPKVVVAGRTFVQVEHTMFEQDLFIMDLIRSSGIDRLELDFTDQTKLNETAEKVLLEAYRKGSLFLIVAGILVEEGEPWTRVGAELNAEFFATLTAPEDKKALQGSVVAVILSFFVDEEGSFAISPKSSEESQSQHDSGESSEAVGTSVTMT